MSIHNAFTITLKTPSPVISRFYPSNPAESLGMREARSCGERLEQPGMGNPSRLTRREATGCTMPTAWESKKEVANNGIGIPRLRYIDTGLPLLELQGCRIWRWNHVPARGPNTGRQIHCDCRKGVSHGHYV